tara:strand:+ start:136 stop:489 length:354 start_codon:yes stop_codon:yes gene_type:complete
MTPLDLARRYFPAASDERLDAIIWNCTGYPNWFDFKKDGRTPAECFNTQLNRISRRCAADPDVVPKSVPLPDPDEKKWTKGQDPNVVPESVPLPDPDEKKWAKNQDPNIVPESESDK